MKKIAVVVLVVLVLLVVAYFGARTWWRNAETNDSDSRTVSISESDITYLPLGDSYTIGESVAEVDRWPNQLASRLQKDGVALKIVENPARTGATSQDVIDRQLPLLSMHSPEFVSLQIGVNDYVQGQTLEQFETNLNTILTTVTASLPPKKIMILTIPDFSETNVGKTFGEPSEIEKSIVAYNAVIVRSAAHNKVQVVDIFGISDEASETPTYTASDNLHPSALQYRLWVDLIYPVAKELLISQ